MNTMHRGLLTLLRSALTGEKLPLPQDFSIADALPLIERQSLHTLAYLGAVTCGLPKSDPVLQQLYGKYLRALLRSEQQLQAIRTLYAAFEENGIDYMPLKGCNLKPLYPKPELRTMGDADILIRTQQYERIVPVLQKLGYTAGEETSHELPWRSPALYLELHKRMIPPEWRAYCGYYGDGWQRAVPVQGCRYGYSPEDEYIYIFCHFTKHFRHRGVGCRPLLDMFVYRRSHPAMDAVYIDAQLQSLQLADFHKNVLQLLECWFAGVAPQPTDEAITEYIFEGGSWGTLEKFLVSREAHLSQYTGKRAKYPSLHAVLEAAFPPARVIADRYPVLKKAPWLVPVVWPWRWVDAVLFRRGKVRTKLDALHSVSDNAVADFRTQLEALGLPFED